jgi:DNA mismatch repair protein MutS
MSKTKKPSEYSKYVKLNTYYENKYGAKTVIFYKLGSFYEIYGNNELLEKLNIINKILDIRLTRKDKNKEANEYNPNFCGVPVETVYKYAKKLTNEKYTVIIIDEIDRDKDTPTEILTCGTTHYDINPIKSNWLMTIIIEENPYSKNYLNIKIDIGICLLDLTTGKSYINEFFSNSNDPLYALDNLVQYIINYQPKEVILGSEYNLETIEYNNIIQILDLYNIQISNRIGKIDILKQNFKKTILEKYFPDKGLYDIYDYLSLENKELATIAFINTLEYCYQCNHKLLNKLNPPIEINDNSCSITYNASNQLSINNLENILNKCITSIGKRNFKEKIRNPITDETILNNKYEFVELFINLLKNKDNKLKVIKELENIYDIERLYRQICAKNLNINKIIQIIESIQAIKELNILIPELTIKDNNIDDLYDYIIDTINLDKCENINNNVFIKGIYPEIDNLENDIQYKKNIFYKLAKELNKYINTIINNKSKNIDYFVITYDKDKYYLEITNSRYKIISNKINEKIFYIDNYHFKWCDFIIINNKSKSKMSCNILDNINNELSEDELKLGICVKIKYEEFLDSISKKYNGLFLELVNYIADIDWYYTCAKTAKEYNYVKPIINNINENKSFIDAKDLRHPIVEQINNNEIYVPNDIQLNYRNNGILLYGVNSSGKSCLAKSVVLSIIMAQTGMYVSASNFIYYPYHKIFTRIPSGDDLMKGYSTFIVELIELNNIIKRSISNSLIIGDELCSGTEDISALCIIGAGILNLCEKNASFIFATHFHKLTKIKEIKKLIQNQNIKVFHLSVEYDITDDKLIYTRKLINGQGNDLYGLEVAKSIIKDNDFLCKAQSIRQDILEIPNTFSSIKKSRYNKDVLIEMCQLCNVNKAEHTHHINEQKLANTDGFINNFHKNNKSNLIPLCKDCHILQHNNNNNKLEYKQTTIGNKLINNIYND